MAIEIRDFTVTIPAGTTISAGFSAAMSFPPRVVTEVHVRVPPGPRGEVGFAIGTGGVNIIPFGSGTYVVTDNEDLIYPLTDTITSGAWQLLGYNTGSFDHTLRVYFYCELVNAGQGGGFTPLPDGSADGSGSGSGSGSGDGTTPPPVVPPPVTPPSPPAPPTVTPPVISPPVTLPPTLPTLPGLGPAPAPPVPSVALIGVADAGQVWILSPGTYVQAVDQATVDAMTAAGVVGVAVSSAQHAALLAAYTKLVRTPAVTGG